MKQLYTKLLLAILAAIAFFMILGWAGRMDYNEQVILKMSQEDYDTIVSRLSCHGRQPSDDDVVQYYIHHFSHR